MDNTKQIECPEHGNVHTATLYVYPHQHAGIWECEVEGISDSHEHENVYMDSVTQDHMGFQGHYQTEHPVWVCEDCGEVVDDVTDEDFQDDCNYDD